VSKWTLGSYNRFLGESITRYGLTRKQAAQHYREMRPQLGRPVFRADLRHHPVIAKRASERAFALRPPVAKVPVKPPELRPPTIPEKILAEFEDDEEITFSEESP